VTLACLETDSPGWVEVPSETPLEKIAISSLVAAADIDFSIGLEGDGSTTNLGGTTVDMKERLGSWAIIASTDIMAADAIAARIVSHKAKHVPQLAMGFNKSRMSQPRANPVCPPNPRSFLWISARSMRYNGPSSRLLPASTGNCGASGLNSEEMRSSKCAEPKSTAAGPAMG
jgi:hypothetical protein